VSQSQSLLKLWALDEYDLAVIAAHLQDAILRVGDMAYLPQTKRFAFVAARFDWLAAEEGRRERCHVGLHFERVLKAASTGFDRAKPETMLNLLDIAFTQKDGPSGIVVLTFSGGAAVRLEVECLEAEMHDLECRWQAKACPEHKFAGETDQS
jgi:hypothetical protein